MKYKKTLALVPALLLAACGGDEQSVNPKATPGSVIYSYPADGQIDVSPKADIVLRFSDALTEEKADLKNKISLKSGNEDIDFGIEKIDGGKSLKLTSDGALKTASKYSVTFDEPLKAAGNRSISIPGNLDDSDIHFNTRGSYSGVAELAETDDVFKIAQQIPASDGEDSPFRAMNFSTFRLILTQPVHPEWDSEERGGSIKLLDQDGQTVPATVLVKGNRITVDPCVTPEKTLCGSKDDILNSGETYTLKLENLTSLTSPDVEYKGLEELEYTPRDTGPTIVLKQSATDSGLANGMSEEAATKSILNGQPINGVTLNSVLQGEAGPSQQTGDMFAELAYAPAFEDNEALPLRIPKGSVLSSTSLDVLVGGKVPVLDAATGELQTTGDIKVTMLSDASGYMSPNPYTDDTSAPRQITLFMDVSMNAEEGQPNAALSQDLMGVELRGIALVRDGVLTIDAIGMVEPALLGQEYTDSTIAFHLEAATDIDSALDADDLREIDRTGPSLVSWMPGDEDAIPNTRQSMHRPGDPVILFFDKPLDPDSVADGVSLSGPGGTSDGETTVGNGLNAEVDGTTLTLNPDGGLIPGGDYIVSVPGLRGINGKPVDILTVRFKMDGEDAPADAPPLALTTYPGFPCETIHDDVDLEAGTHGQCWDAAPDGEAGDVLPISEMPADRPITVVFSQPMSLDSIRLGDTFTVEKVEASPKNPAKEEDKDKFVAGRLEKNNQRIRFYPDEPWEPGKFYRYTMKVDRDSAAVQEDSSCTPQKESRSICGLNNFPLKTDLLEGLEKGDGKDGKNSMIIYFEGVEAQDSVFTALRNLPVRDTNANLKIDNFEPGNYQPSGNGGYLPPANSAKLLVNVKDQKRQARVGCAIGSTEKDECEKNKFIYQTYALNTEVVGPKIFKSDDGKKKEGLEVLLYPTSIATTSLTVHTDTLDIASITGPQILRMRYAEDPSGCDEETAVCRNSLIPGIIVENDKGQPVFKTTVDVFIDAPDLKLDTFLIVDHNLYSYPFTLELSGNVTFFNDGRMQIEQYNLNVPEINVNSELLAGIIKKTIPLLIPEKGLYLNFISNPVKDLPARFE